jgi:hypothetical protein
MKSKLAIVGCASQTRDSVDYEDKDLDIWVFNESAQKSWCKRADAVLQLHDRPVWKSPVNRGDEKHGEWLMSGNTPLIWMWEKYPEVPKAERLPREDIVDTLLKTLEIDSERGRKDFFTSTTAFAIALGIHLGYKEIHTYGIELMDEEEYREQQPCAMFWMGLAVGRGVKLVTHSQMFDAPLYPIETFVGLDKTLFSDQIAALSPKRDAARDTYIKIKADVDELIKKFEESGSGSKEELVNAIQNQAKYGQEFGLLDGAIQENDRYFQRSFAMEQMTKTYVFSRHEFRRDLTQIGVNRQNALTDLNNAAVEVQRIINRIEPKVFDSLRRQAFKQLGEAIDNYIKQAVIIAMYTGAINEDDRFILILEEEKKKGMLREK